MSLNSYLNEIIQYWIMIGCCWQICHAYSELKLDTIWKKIIKLCLLLTHHRSSIKSNNNSKPPAMATPIIQGSTLLGGGANLPAFTYVTTFNRNKTCLSLKYAFYLRLLNPQLSRWLILNKTKFNPNMSVHL